MGYGSRAIELLTKYYEGALYSGTGGEEGEDSSEESSGEESEEESEEEEEESEEDGEEEEGEDDKKGEPNWKIRKENVLQYSTGLVTRKHLTRI